MFEELRKSDIDEALSLLMHAAHRKAREAKDRINLEAMQASAFQSNRVIFVIAEEINKIHIDSIEEAKKILLDFIPRLRKPATTITGWARPHLENLSNTIRGKPNSRVTSRQTRSHVASQSSITLSETEVCGMASADGCGSGSSSGS